MSIQNNNHQPIYVILLSKSSGEGIDLFFLDHDPALTNNAKMLILVEEEGYSYGITIYLMHLYSHEHDHNVFHHLTDRAADLIAAWDDWGRSEEGCMLCLHCNRLIEPREMTSQLYRQSSTGEAAYWIKIEYACPVCGNRMRFSRQWYPPDVDRPDRVDLLIADEEDSQ